jgi:hypothetical protein
MMAPDRVPCTWRLAVRRGLATIIELATLDGSLAGSWSSVGPIPSRGPWWVRGLVPKWVPKSFPGWLPFRSNTCSFAHTSRGDDNFLRFDHSSSRYRTPFYCHLIFWYRLEACTALPQWHQMCPTLLSSSDVAQFLIFYHVRFLYVNIFFLFFTTLMWRFR